MSVKVISVNCVVMFAGSYEAYQQNRFLIVR
jgi:hypothetical protein